MRIDLNSWGIREMWRLIFALTLVNIGVTVVLHRNWYATINAMLAAWFAYTCGDMSKDMKE